jgi:hypothetical protein
MAMLGETESPLCNEAENEADEIARESMPVDALFVGGGPACLAGWLGLAGVSLHCRSSPPSLSIASLQRLWPLSVLGF